jgi:hypothetical protein
VLYSTKKYLSLCCQRREREENLEPGRQIRKNIQKLIKEKIMKTLTNNLFSSFNQTQVEKFAMEVKETVAQGLVINRSKRFGAADLWNIERRRRTIAQRRHFI